MGKIRVALPGSTGAGTQTLGFQIPHSPEASLAFAENASWMVSQLCFCPFIPSLSIDSANITSICSVPDAELGPWDTMRIKQRQPLPAWSQSLTKLCYKCVVTEGDECQKGKAMGLPALLDLRLEGVWSQRVWSRPFWVWGHIHHSLAVALGIYSISLCLSFPVRQTVLPPWVALRGSMC